VDNEDHARRIVQKLADNRKDRILPFTLAGLREENQAKVVEKVEQERQEEIKNLTFSEIFSEYLIHSQATKKNPRSWMREEQLARLHIFPVVGKNPLSKIAEVPHLRNLQKNMEKAGLAPRTIRYALHVVRIVFHFAMDEGYFAGINPALEKSKNAVSKNRSGINYPQEDNKKERYLSRDETELLMKELAKKSGEVHDMAMLSLYAGLRFGEIAKLTWGNVDLFHGTVKLRQTKNGKDRTAYLNSDIQQMFAQRSPGEPDRLVFPARGTDNESHYMISRMYYDTVKKLFNQGITVKKKWVNFHTLRHYVESDIMESVA
jgi:integrase